MQYERKRNCPKCGIELVYNNKSVFCSAKKKNSLCRKCACLKKDLNGERNPFYGKTHTAETKEKLKKTDRQHWKTKEFRAKMSKITSGKNNGMYGRNDYEVWIEKYGKDEADKRLDALKQKLSVAFSGVNNPMYGKPTPQGAGNGWSGWYNGWYFRSLK